MLVNTRNKDLPKGDRWSAFDTLSWITFGEVRAAAADFEFPRKDWSRDWKHWPPEWLAYAFNEIETGIPWTPDPDEIGPFGPDNQREWALRIIEDTGEEAGPLLQALTADIARYHENQDRWAKAKASVNEAMRRGDLRVWGVREIAPSRPDPDGVPALIDPLVFTETRGVDEGSRIDWTSDGLGFIDYKGPTYDRVFFDSAEVMGLWATTAKVLPHILEWLTDAAEAFLADKGGKPKRDGLLRDCVEALRCRYEDAEAAHKELPDHLRRKRGERG
jgi:hypothetical protein